MPLEFHLAEYTRDREWALSAVLEFQRAIVIELYGEDLTWGIESLREDYDNENDGITGVILAIPGPADPTAPVGRFGLPALPEHPVALLGVAAFRLPSADNTHLCSDVRIRVRADLRRQGLGTALWEAIVRAAKQWGRTAILGNSNHLVAAIDPSVPTAAPSTGVGNVPLDAGALFARSVGLSLEQVERESRLVLPVDPDLLAQLRAESEQVALPAYRLESVVGVAGLEAREAIAQLNTVLSTDAPTGGVDWQEENWDAERVLQMHESMQTIGQVFTTIAYDTATGEPAAMTDIFASRERPEHTGQMATAVVPAHRGHRLGMLIKTANLQLLAEHWPQAREVTTWNAGENEHMLAINTALGYRLWVLHGAWQGRLD